MANTTPTLRIKAAARKLPIKRKTPPLTQSLTSSDPNPSPNPNPKPNPNTPDPYASAIVPAENDYDDEYDDDDGDSGSAAADAEAGELKSPPFKFHRVWSESDEIRFLQGLLGCWSQGLVFPRDLNVFYNRFSESMPQPYTRSQLSEKLRRLRSKFRIVSDRIAKGQDPNRLAPHDRDLLHLCTRLWSPSYAASSPFSAAAAAVVGNKRRRRSTASAGPSSSSPPTLALPAPPPPPPPTPAVDKLVPEEANPPPVEVKKPLASRPAGSDKESSERLLAETVLDAFDGSLNSIRTELASNGAIKPDASVVSFSKRWQDQRVAELEVLSRRLRLLVEDSIRG